MLDDAFNFQIEKNASQKSFNRRRERKIITYHEKGLSKLEISRRLKVAKHVVRIFLQLKTNYVKNSIKQIIMAENICAR